MYRNYRHCGCNNNNCGYKCNEDDCLETACAGMQNVESLYEDCKCGFGEDNTFPMNPVLAQSYVPIQRMNQTFVPCVGLKMGTIYPELVSPYMLGQSQAEIEFIEATNQIGEGCNQC